MRRFIIILILLAIAGGVAGAVMSRPRFDDYEELYFYLLDSTPGPHDESFAALPGPVQQMYVAAILDMEIQNGGLCQFFVNCGTDYAPLTAAALRAVGVEPMAELYEAFLSDNDISMEDAAAFEIVNFTMDDMDRYAALAKSYPFDAFDDAYMSLWESLHFEQAMLDYANAHAEELKG